jgi:hypothetical protein
MSGLTDASITDIVVVVQANCLLERWNMLHHDEGTLLRNAAAVIVIVRSRFFIKNDGNIFGCDGDRGTLIVVTSIIEEERHI